MSIAEKLTTIAENQQKVYDAGQKSEYDSFWDVFQDDGDRTEYPYAFFRWSNAVYKPKYIPKPTSCQNMYGMSKIEEIIVDLTNMTGSMNSAFGNNDALRKLTAYSSDVTSWSSTAFQNSSSITEIIIVGTISRTIRVDYCTNLTHDSLMSIINALYDFTGNGETTTYKVQMGPTNLAKLTDEELGIIQSKGWTYS